MTGTDTQAGITPQSAAPAQAPRGISMNFVTLCMPHVEAILVHPKLTKEAFEKLCDLFKLDAKKAQSKLDALTRKIWFPMKVSDFRDCCTPDELSPILESLTNLHQSLDASIHSSQTPFHALTTNRGMNTHRRQFRKSNRIIPRGDSPETREALFALQSAVRAGALQTHREALIKACHCENPDRVPLRPMHAARRLIATIRTLGRLSPEPAMRAIADNLKAIEIEAAREKGKKERQTQFHDPQYKLCLKMIGDISRDVNKSRAKNVVAAGLMLEELFPEPEQKHPTGRRYLRMEFAQMYPKMSEEQRRDFVRSLKGIQEILSDELAIILDKRASRIARSEAKSLESTGESAPSSDQATDSPQEQGDDQASQQADSDSQHAGPAAAVAVHDEQLREAEDLLERIFSSDKFYQDEGVAVFAELLDSMSGVWPEVAGTFLKYVQDNLGSSSAKGRDGVLKTLRKCANKLEE